MGGAGVKTGLEVMKGRGFAPLLGRRVGVLTNPTAVDGDYRHLIPLMLEAGVDVRVIFGPEHGLFSTAQDMVGVERERHAMRLVSLYDGTYESLAPHEADMREIDVLVFDIQDVGCRTYTYQWSLALAMGVAKKTGAEVMVLDRPNPITGRIVEGGGMAPALRSFVGLHDVPNRTGMTVGEVATLVAGEIGFEGLTVVKMEGWARGLWHDQTGAPWVIPSPNMPTLDTAIVFTGGCLIEGTNLSEGRGTTRPFEFVGAPFIEEGRLADALDAEGLPGARFRPVRFQPGFQKWAGQVCAGVQIHVADREAFHSLNTGLAILRNVRALWPREFQWRTEMYEFRDDVPAVDLLTGQARVREMIDAGAPLAEIAGWLDATGAANRKARLAALLYQ